MSGAGRGRGECIAEGPFGRAIHSSCSLAREFVGNVGAMNQENTLRNGNEIYWNHKTPRAKLDKKEMRDCIDGVALAHRSSTGL